MRKLLCLAFTILVEATSHAQIVDEDSLYSRAATFLRYSAMDSASSTLRRLLELYPTSARAYNTLGAILTDQGNDDEAIEMFHKCIRADSTFYVAYMNLGNAYIDQGKLDSAIAIHALVASKDSGNAEHFGDLGDAYFKKDDIARAELSFKKAVQLNPHYTLAHRNLGVVYWKEEKYEEAIDELFLVRNLDEFYPQLQNDLHRVAMAAESAFEEWAKREPNSGDAHYYYSFYLYYDNDRTEAVDELDKAIAINPREEKYYFVKSLWLWNLAKYEDAVKECKECLKLNPDNWMCHQRIAFCYSGMQDLSSKIEHLKKAIEIDSLVQQSHFSLGEAYAQNREYEKAINPLRKALGLGHKSPWANYDLAVCYYNLGQYQMALQNIAMAKNRNARHPRKGAEAQFDQLLENIKAKLDTTKATIE